MIPLVHFHPTNRVGRTFVAGDLHGCYNQLMALMNAVNFDFSKDILYQTGDLGNRGPHSYRCLELAVTAPWLRAVKGNHEEELIKAANDPMYNWDHLIRHGAKWAYDLPRMTLRLLMDRVRLLPSAIVVGEGPERFNVFHGEFHGDDAKLDALNGRQWPPVYLVGGRDLHRGKISPDIHKGLSPSFVGHSIVKQPTMIGSHIYIDTGSYRGEHDPSHPGGVTFFEPATQQAWQYSKGTVIRTL